ncbi:MAG: TonB-dependent receptor [Nitrospiraceae bacterium]
MTYLLTPTTSLYFNYSEGFRVPTINELFALGPFGVKSESAASEDQEL